MVEDKDIVQLDTCNHLSTASQLFRIYSGRLLQLKALSFANPAVRWKTVTGADRLIPQPFPSFLFVLVRDLT